MPGSSRGGRKAAATNKAKYGEDYYKKIGTKGGARSNTGGFWHAKYVLGDVDKIRKAGSKGGSIGGLKTKEQYKTRQKNVVGNEDFIDQITPGEWGKMAKEKNQKVLEGRA